MKKKLFTLASVVCSGLFASTLAFAAPASQTAQVPQCPAPSVIKSATYSFTSHHLSYFYDVKGNIIIVSANNKASAEKLLNNITSSYKIKKANSPDAHYYYCNYGPYNNPAAPSGLNVNATPFVNYQFS